MKTMSTIITNENINCIVLETLTDVTLSSDLSSENIDLVFSRCVNISKLKCVNCINITNIPVLPKLTTLKCNSCSSLTSIPVLPNLTKLESKYCSNLDKNSIPIKFISKTISLNYLVSLLTYNPDNINSVFISKYITEFTILELCNHHLDLFYSYCDLKTLDKLHALMTKNNISLPILIKACK